MHVARLTSECEVPVDGRRLGKYELVAKIGSGGMAEVHLARLCGPMGFQKVVVLKTIHTHLAAQPEFLTMLFDEARISALLKHPRVVDIYDLGEVDGTYFIAMEHLVGQPLSQLMSASASSNGPTLDVYSMARIIADTADGLSAAHDLKSMSGEPLELVHRDMSPGNVVVLYDGNVKIVDFGVAKARGRLTESGLHSLKGKSGYMSPEQIAGAPVDRRSDVFGLGVVLWEALALRRLFQASSELATCNRVLADEVPPPSQFRAEVPPELDAICLRAMARDPADRYQTATDMRIAIEAFLARSGRRGREQIEAFMTTRFGRRRDARDRAIRRLAAANDDDDLDIEIAVGTHAGAEDVESAVEIEDTPAPPTAPRRRSARRAWLAAATLACATLCAGLYHATASAPATPRARAARVRTAAPAVRSARAARVRTAAPAVRSALAVATTPPATAAAPDAHPPPASKPAPAPERTERDPRQVTAAANRYYVQGNHSRAKSLYKKAIRTNPRYAPAHRGLGLVYEKLGRDARAKRSLETYLKLAPDANDATVIRKRIAQLGS